MGESTYRPTLSVTWLNCLASRTTLFRIMIWVFFCLLLIGSNLRSGTMLSLSIICGLSVVLFGLSTAICLRIISHQKTELTQTLLKLVEQEKEHSTRLLNQRQSMELRMEAQQRNHQEIQRELLDRMMAGSLSELRATSIPEVVYEPEQEYLREVEEAEVVVDYRDDLRELGILGEG